MPEFNSKKEWEAAADKLFADGVSPQEINSIVGEYNGPEGIFTVQQAKKSKRGWLPVDKNRRGVRNAKRVKMERDQSMGIGDTVEPRGTTSASLRSELGAVKGDEIHHRISLIQNTPFFDELSDAESREFVSWINDQGWNIGNQPGNPEIVIPKKDHTDVHAWLRNNGIEGARGPQARLIEGFKGMSMDDRKYAFRNYMEYVQGGADEFMAEKLGDISQSETHNAAQLKNRQIVQQQNEVERLKGQIGDIPSGPRAGQRMPVNRVTLGNAIIDDIVNTGGNIKFNMSPQKLAVLGLSTFSAFGTGASAIETGLRGKQALETGNPTDWVQTGLSAASLIADPIPVVGELVSTPADAANVAIDTYREPGFKATPNPLEARNQQLNNSLKTNPKPTPEPKYEAGYETLGRLGNQMLGGLKQVGGKILFGF